MSLSPNTPQIHVFLVIVWKDTKIEKFSNICGVQLPSLKTPTPGRADWREVEKRRTVKWIKAIERYKLVSFCPNESRWTRSVQIIQSDSCDSNEMHILLLITTIFMQNKSFLIDVCASNWVKRHIPIQYPVCLKLQQKLYSILFCIFWRFWKRV